MKRRLNAFNGVLIFCASFACATPSYSNISNVSSCGSSSIEGPSCASAVDPGVTPIWAQSRRHVGNPVDVITGNKYQREIDYQAVGSRLHLSRYYNSALSDVNVGLGQGWRHSYLVKLIELDSDRRQIEQADGRTIEFVRLSDSSSLFMAYHEQDGYIHDDEQAQWFVGDGRILGFYGSHLVKIDYPDGSSLQLTYKANQLHSVRDQHSQQIQFEYSAVNSGLRHYTQQSGELDAHLKAIVLPSGEQLHYRYDASSNLTSVKSNKNPIAVYEYTDTGYPNHLTTISGPNKQQRHWRYNSTGAVETYINDTTQQRLDVTYYGDTDLDQYGETLVKHSSGKQEQFHWQRNAASQQLFVSRVDSQVDSQVNRRNDHQRDDNATRFSYSPEAHAVQQAADVKLAHSQYMQAVKDPGSAQSLTKDMTSLEDVDLSDIEIFPIDSSLNSRVVLRVNGADLEFVIHADRLGKVTQITFGQTSLKEMTNKWVSGDIVRCDAEPLFQRAVQLPKPEKSCLEDFVFLVELAERVTQFNQSGSHNDVSPEPRSKSASSPIGQQPCLINPFATCTELERNFELAQLTSCAYKVVVITCGQDWEAVDPASLNLNADEFNFESFSATLFLNNQTKEYVLAFRGTDDNGDWKDNILQAVGVSTTQYRRAAKLARLVRQALPNETLSTAGHSLGGGLATAAALQIGVEGNVFNPAALNDKTADKLGLNNYSDAANLVSVTTMRGDLLTRVQNWVYAESSFYDWYGAPNTHTALAKPDRAWLDNFKQNDPSSMGFDSIALHKIDSILASNEAILKAACGITASRA